MVMQGTVRLAGVCEERIAILEAIRHWKNIAVGEEESAQKIERFIWKEKIKYLNAIFRNRLSRIFGVLKKFLPE